MNSISIKNNKQTASYLKDVPFRCTSVYSDEKTYIGELIFTNHKSYRKVHQGCNVWDLFSFFPATGKNIKMKETVNGPIIIGRYNGEDRRISFHEKMTCPNGMPFEKKLKNINFKPSEISWFELRYLMSQISWSGTPAFSKEEIEELLLKEKQTTEFINNETLSTEIEFWFDESCAFSTQLAQTMRKHILSESE